jgi:hypothetical protein
MEDGEEDGPLDLELEAASVEELLDDSLAPRLLPEPLEDQGGSDASRGDGRELALGVSPEEEDGRGEACPRDQEGIELAGLLELIESSRGGNAPLPGSAVLPSVLDDLEVSSWPGGLGSEEHGALVVESP